ncbi:MAG: glycine cleavage T C-terminal barrel domain-containing protein [Pseudomonadota bacterium]
MIFPAADATLLEPKPTALYAAIATVSSANSWTSVNGWSTPTVYTTVQEEYDLLTTEAAVADFGPLCRYVVRGDAAVDYLGRVTTAPAANLSIGESARGLVVSADGAVSDIVEVSRLGAKMYLLTTTHPHGRRLQLAGRGLNAEFEDISGRIAALALIGPKAREAAKVSGLSSASDTVAAQTIVRGVETATRPIEIGSQPGVEIIYPYKEALTIWERVRRAADLKPAGLDAFEILRIESGTPRPGVDFISADVANQPGLLRSPAAIGLPHLAPLDRAWFNGRRALLRKTPHSERVLKVLALDDERCEIGAEVTSGGAPTGKVTSAAFSPRLKRVVVFADIAKGADKKPLEVAGPRGERMAARLFSTAESERADAFAAASGKATESARGIV